VGFDAGIKLEEGYKPLGPETVEPTTIGWGAPKRVGGPTETPNCDTTEVTGLSYVAVLGIPNEFELAGG
jgi:hypothetical protein